MQHHATFLQKSPPCRDPLSPRADRPILQSLHPSALSAALRGDSLLPVQGRQYIDEVVDLLFEGGSSGSRPLARRPCR